MCNLSANNKYLQLANYHLKHTTNIPTKKTSKKYDITNNKKCDFTSTIIFTNTIIKEYKCKGYEVKQKEEELKKGHDTSHCQCNFTCDPHHPDCGMEEK